MHEFSQIVDQYRDLILAAERDIWKTPETGYKEVKTSAYMAKKFRSLGYSLTMAEGITGFYTVVDTGREGPEVLVLGELDSILCPAHPDADPTTGAVHSCGHHAQCAALLGVAAALRDERVLAKLSGRIRLCAVPAEELLELEYRAELKKQGKIKYFGGKSEFLSRGYFDGVDLALMVHTSTSYSTHGGSVGCLVKNITYHGKAAHAGGAPQDGKNALYAANCGLTAVNALRETFREKDCIRVHPIITRGGDMVNAIPETVTMESYVRGKTFEAIVRENEKVNRALCGAALSLGNNIEINDTPGYSPLVNAPDMIDLADEAMALALPEVEFHRNDQYFSTGSTDMGDLSSFMPVVHPYAGGACGNAHGNDYQICDPELACVGSAKWQLAMLLLLLGNGAERAKKIVEDFEPTFPSAKAFLAYQDSLNRSGERITYREDGSAEVRWK
ncbi:MAG: amidohydrolase [Clostridia bacterium]|nr:amidohydrolase [Clostridia bacterium]